VKLALHKLFEVPKELKIFEFGYRIIKQSFHVTHLDFGPYNNKVLERNSLNGYITSADFMKPEDAGTLLKALQDGKELPITWNHESDTYKYPFTIDSIFRTITESKVILEWNGSGIGIDVEGSDTLTIPALGDFKAMEIKVQQQPSQSLIIQFSDPLEEGQNLDGLVRMDKGGDCKFEIANNTIKAYPASRQSGLRMVYVEAGIKNVSGFKMKDPYNIEVSFEELKPEVKLIGQGVIVPNSDGLIFPFEAVNLNAVDLKVTKIFENNITQFLQVNQLDGLSEIGRVGKQIIKKKIPLNVNPGLDGGKWNAYSVDLAEIISKDPGAIYQVEISFKKEYSVFKCSGESKSDQDMESYDNEWEEEGIESEDYYYDYSYYYYYPPGYEWEERDNPCHVSYYNGSRWIRRNVFASNLGIIAKGISDKTLKVAVTDIRSTEPLSGVKVEVYDYQQQKIIETTTNSDGFADIKLEEKPFLLIAKKGNEKGYLRLDDGSSLSISMFDVTGNEVQKGIKGFIYGERGVWRPGDTLFLTFILEDKKDVLPAGHPVSFELVNPQGQVVTTMVKTKGLNGFYDFTTKTDPDAPTGIWSINVQVGGSKFRKNIRIETVKPNRLKISLDYGVSVISADNSNLQGNLNVKWLHGAVTKNLKANVTVTLNSIQTKFKNYEGFNFDDNSKMFYAEEQVVFDDRVNIAGEAKVKADLGSYTQAPGMLKANFMVRAFEEGGEFSTDFFSIPYAPYKNFIGIKLPKTGNYGEMLVTDSTYTVIIAAVDKNGTPVSASGLIVSLYKVRWRWWWEVSNENFGNYVGYNSEDLISSKKVDVMNGQGTYDFKIAYPDWGRFMIRVVDPVGGHSVTQVFYADWPSWVSRDKRKQPEGAKILSFSADKETYKVGETATITIPTSGEGRALVSIETGSEILDAHWVLPEKDQKETRVSFKITEQMCPNIYIHVTYIQPHAQTANDLPIRLYGIVPVNVEDPGTIIKPVIVMKSELSPEKEFTISVSEEKSRPMTYTLALVDDGLLDLTRFKTPDPWSVFYAKEALGVKTWDLFDLILGAYGGKMEKLFAIGGDAGSIVKPNEKANRFKPVVMFLGPFELKGGSQTHKLKMPRYIGSVRAMVIAGNDGAYGFAEKTVPVKNPLMILGTLPRVLGPGETVSLPVTVFAMDKKVKNVKVEIKSNNLLKVIGESTKQIEFTTTGDEIINFELSAAENIGVGKVSIIANSGDEKATYDIELDVRTPNPPVTKYLEKIIQPGEVWSTEYLPVGMAGTNEGNLEVSNIPPIDFGRRLKELIGYPYGCSEQMTSSVFPQLFLQNVMELDDVLKDYTSKNIKEGIRKIGFMQLSNGGFRYWPDAVAANDWVTSYAGHFMLEAEAKGYSLPSGYKDKWIKYQENAARSWKQNASKFYDYYYHHHLTQAYRLYTLALANAPDLSSMNRLRELPGLTPLAKWQLAGAYALAGQMEVAKELITNLETEVVSYGLMNDTYGSDLRDKAIILETLVLMGEKEKAAPLVIDISKKISGQYWYSTQTTAFCLMSLAQFAGTTNLVGNELKFDYNFDNNGTQTKRTQLPLSQVKLDIKGKEKGTITVKNNGQSIIYAKIALTGLPVAGQESYAENKLKMKVSYKTLEGKEIQPDKISQGTDFIAEVEISNPGIYGYYKEMALTQILPSGWEIINTRIADVTSANEASKPDYRDIRDDRVNTFFGIGNQFKKFTIVLNAAYLGRYYLPAVKCEAMYDNSINALVPGRWVKVVKPGN
jgi:alpha-2-macroglobulin